MSLRPTSYWIYTYSGLNYLYQLEIHFLRRLRILRGFYVFVGVVKGAKSVESVEGTECLEETVEGTESVEKAVKDTFC